MTTEEILQSIEDNLSNAYSSLEKRKKVTMPAKKNFENLATTIDSIEPLLEEITIEPKTTSQLFTPSGENEGIGKVNVKAVTSEIDANIIPTNIRKGKTILGVVGNVEVDKPNQEKTVNPTTSQQSVVADTGYELSKVTVNAVTSSIDSNIKAENIKDGVSILGVTGTFEGGIAPSGTIDITTNGIHDVTNYASANVNVEADLNERVIIGTWSFEGNAILLKPNGVASFSGMTGTYTISGNQVTISMPQGEPLILTYNSDTDTLTDGTITLSKIEDVREKDIFGEWLISENNIFDFEMNGVVSQKANGVTVSSGTYEILGTTIMVTLTGNVTFAFTYNEETDTLYEPYENITLTRVGTTLITKEITENGTYNASDDGAYGYSSVNVNVVTGEYNVESVVNEDGTTQTLVITHYGYVENYDGTYLNTSSSTNRHSLISFVLEGDTITSYSSGQGFNDISMTIVSSVTYSNKVVTITYSDGSTQQLTYDASVDGFVGQVYEVSGMGRLTAVDVTFAKESV